jgi:hypothetical protein
MNPQIVFVYFVSAEAVKEDMLDLMALKGTERMLM